jgi:hypothetical protein
MESQKPYLDITNVFPKTKNSECLEAETNNFLYFQPGLLGIGETKNVTPDVPAAQIPLSQLKHWYQFHELLRNHEKLDKCFKPPKTKELLNIYFDTQARQFMAYAYSFWQIEKLDQVGLKTPGNYFCLYQDSLQWKLDDVVMNYAMSLTTEVSGPDRAVLRALNATNYWRYQQNFDCKLFPAQQTLHEDSQFKPGVREKVWYDDRITNKLLQLAENVLLHLKSPEALKYSPLEQSRALRSSPMILYLRRNHREAIQVWTQPDLAGEDGVVQWKIGQELKSKDDLDPLEKLQILLLAVASEFEMKDDLSKEATRMDKPLFRSINPDKLAKRPPKALVRNINPMELRSDGSFAEENVTLTEDEASVVWYGLQYIFEWFADMSNRNNFKKFNDRRTRIQEAAIPSPKYSKDNGKEFTPRLLI